MNESVNLHWTNIAPNPLNQHVRGQIDDDADIAGLAESIRQHGVLQSLTVLRNGAEPGQPEYLLLNGDRRWRACRLLGDDAPLLPCIVRPAPATELDALVLIGMENLQRNNLSPMAEAGYYQSLAERLPPDDREQPERALARLLHKTATHIRARLDLLGLEPEVQAMVDRKVLPQSAAPHLLRLSGASQVEVARAAQGRPVKDVARLVDNRLLRDRGLGQLSQERRPDPPVEELPVSPNGRSGDGVPLEALTLAVRATCGACQLAGASGGLSEILWLDVHEALAQSCRACNVSNMREACLACPVVDFLQHLVTLLRESGGVHREALPEHLYEKRVLVR